MKTRLLICQEAELKELNRKHHKHNSIANLKAELEELGAQDVLPLKAYSKTNGISANDVKLMYLLGEKSVVFKAEGTDEDFDNLEVYLTLSDMDFRMYPFPSEELKNKFKETFIPILKEWNKEAHLIVQYWAYRSNRESSYIHMSDKKWRKQLSLITELRDKSGPADSYDAEAREGKLFSEFTKKFAADVPSGMKTFGDLNRYMYQTAEFFGLDVTRKY
ncbi:hypothetical protein NVP2275O_449 [Vibrio phage 2.275.O._10N.286.54.E11]|nr:hypothetical protein NVP2275O_449 [Vibrio phage 2.275.O._10N.286.54.E11]